MRTDIPAAGLTADKLRDEVKRYVRSRDFTTLEVAYVLVEHEWYDSAEWHNQLPEDPGDPQWSLAVAFETNRDDLCCRLLEAGFRPTIGRLDDGEAWIMGWHWP